MTHLGKNISKTDESKEFALFGFILVLRWFN